MKLGVVVDDNNWTFISEILNYWHKNFQVEEFTSQIYDPFIVQKKFKKWRLMKSLKRFMDRNDVVFFEWAGQLLIICSKLSIRKPIIVRLHSYELFPHAPYVSWENVELIILVSKAMQQKFVALFPDQAAKTRVVNCGTSIYELKSLRHRNGNNIGMLCSLIPLKRVYEVILALYELRKKGYVFRLHIGGEVCKGADNERYNASMLNAIEKLGLQDQVVFYGRVNDVVSWWGKIDMFISNSYWEGQQNALLEAMAGGCYCLSHFWDGADEVLPQEYLFVGNEELQEKIIEYYKMSNEEKQRHQDKQLSIVRGKFNIEDVKTRLREIVLEIAGTGQIATT